MENDMTTIEKSKKISAMSITSLILGILTMPGVFCCVGFLTGLLSIMFGIIGLVHVHNNEANTTSKVISWTGISMSVLSMGLYLIYFMVVLGGTMSSIPAYNP
jgi:ABC-type antimicrobial peptide transport system permease subunit